MTSHKHLKQLVRARMTRTGERYAAARRQVLAQAATPGDGPGGAHLPGNVPATTALRILLAHANLAGPGGKPLSEALTFVLAGGIGAGAFAFLYEKQDWASLFIGGRHLWQDDEHYLDAAARRLGVKPVVRESAAARVADRQLREALEQGGPVIAWVDAAHLPHRALPTQWSGGGYHVVTVYAIEGDHALIGDLTDEPVPIALSDLARARARIRKQRHRLLWLERGNRRRVDDAVLERALTACARGLTHQRLRNFTLDSFADLAERIAGGRDRQSWDAMFPPGGRLWSALTSLCNYIEHYGTGGGLCRSIFAEGLLEASAGFGRPGLATPAGRYARLGQSWSALAESALPDAIPPCREARELLARKAEFTHSGGTPAEIRECSEELGRLDQAARKRFPISPPGVAELRAQLSRRLAEVHAEEVGALDSLMAGARGEE
jgi:Butirosin biosynthesis protein H, N-terminal/Domain of unknown function (DUF4872)